MRLLCLTLIVSALQAQIAGPIRNKLSAGDLLSAQSILEVHEREKGRDAHFVEGLAWVARGAVLLGDFKRAETLDQQLRALIDEKLAGGSDLSKDNGLAAALGAQIEVHAQILKKKQAIAYLESQLTKFAAPVSLRARIYKRLNMLTLPGAAAPEFAVEEALSAKPVSLAELKGSPVLVFGWAQWCGDCRAQAAAIGRIRKKYESRGLRIVMLTRYYETDKTAERAAIAKAWNETYRELDGLPSIISRKSMERYGVSSTPTFTLVDKKGKVAAYLPYRLTEAELDRLITGIL